MRMLRKKAPVNMASLKKAKREELERADKLKQKAMFSLHKKKDPASRTQALLQKFLEEKKREVDLDKSVERRLSQRRKTRQSVVGALGDDPEAKVTESARACS